MQLLGKVCDGSIRARAPLQNSAPGGVRKRGKRDIGMGAYTPNHIVPPLSYPFPVRKAAPGPRRYRPRIVGRLRSRISLVRPKISSTNFCGTCVWRLSLTN